jgi:glutaconate CoA-transferase subunit A
MDGEKLLARVDVAYVVGLEARGLSPHARRVMESGEIEVCEWTNYALACRLRAAASGVPFIPARCMLGTDTFSRSAAVEIECPFTGQRLVALPAVYPDVAFIHVHESDCYGNCRIKGITVADLDLARAAKRLIITTERLVSNDEIRSAPNATVIPSFCVDAVCEVPYGSYPGNMQGEYYSDEGHLCQWLEAERHEAGFKSFLSKYIYDVPDFESYLRLCGGIERIKQLRAQELLLPGGA